MGEDMNGKQLGKFVSAEDAHKWIKAITFLTHPVYNGHKMVVCRCEIGWNFALGFAYLGLIQYVSAVAAVV